MLGELAIQRLADRVVLHEIAAYEQLPPHPDAPADSEDELSWDEGCGFLDENTVIASTSQMDEQYGHRRHWPIDATRGQVEYPASVSRAAVALGDGTWLTCAEDPFQLLLWTLPQGAVSRPDDPAGC